jgi:hypothetical protein
MPSSSSRCASLAALVLSVASCTGGAGAVDGPVSVSHPDVLDATVAADAPGGADGSLSFVVLPGAEASTCADAGCLAEASVPHPCPAAACPLEHPDAGEPCIHVNCEYADDDAGPGCTQTYSCGATGVVVTKSCSSRSPGTGCPGSAPDAGASCEPTGNGPGAMCQYPGSVCQCSTWVDAGSLWECLSIPANCPPLSPPPGSVCETDAGLCSYTFGECDGLGFGSYVCDCGEWVQLPQAPCAP